MAFRYLTPERDQEPLSRRSSRSLRIGVALDARSFRPRNAQAPVYLPDQPVVVPAHSAVNSP